MKVLYDYEAAAPGELSVQEDEVLLVFETEQDWLLVQSQREGGKAGFVPGNYVEAYTEGESPQASQIIVPPSVRAFLPDSSTYLILYRPLVLSAPMSTLLTVWLPPKSLRMALRRGLCQK